MSTCYSQEFAQMKKSVAAAKDSGASGLVFGILKADRFVDIDRTRELVELAQPLPVTFHRAFDACPDLAQALRGVLRSGASRILTSGGAASAPEGTDNFSDACCGGRQTRHGCSRIGHQCGEYFAACRGYTSAGVSFRLEQRAPPAHGGLRTV